MLPLGREAKAAFGIFQALQAAREAFDSPGWALREVLEVNDWSDMNLGVPKHFSRGTDGQACLSWYKPTAEEHIKQMYRLKAALEACGVHVELLKTKRPGRIVWQDDYQIVAEPGPSRF
jgi:hypothetical protein